MMNILTFLSFMMVSAGMYIVIMRMNPLLKYLKAKSWKKILSSVLGICIFDLLGIYLKIPAFSVVVPLISIHIIYVTRMGHYARFDGKAIIKAALIVGFEFVFTWYLHEIRGSYEGFDKRNIMVMCMLFTALLQVWIIHAESALHYWRERWANYYLIGSIRIVFISCLLYEVFWVMASPLAKQLLFVMIIGVIVLEYYCFYYFDQIRRYEIENERRIQVPLNREEYYLEMEEDHLKIRRLYHDMKNQMMIMQEMSAGNAEDVSSYINETMEQIEGMNQFYHTGNKQLDVFLHEANRRAEEKGIRFHAVIQENSMDFMAPGDIKAIFVNAVMNAIEACEKVEEDEKSIDIMVGAHAGDVIMTFVNTKQPGSTRKHLETTKTDGGIHGIGLINIQRAIENYDGYMTIDDEERSFRLSILIVKEESDNA